MKQTRRRCLALLFVLPVACISATACAADLVVSAASSLTNAFQEVARAYEAVHPETHVVLNFASSDTLMRQIVQGAPVDVFASADQTAMDHAQAQGVLAQEDTAGSVAEIDARAADRNFTQILVLPRTDEPLGRRRYWPIFEAAVRNNLPIAVHVVSQQDFNTWLDQAKKKFSAVPGLNPDMVASAAAPAQH